MTSMMKTTKNERNLNDMMGEVTLKKSEDSTKNEDYPKY